MKYLKTFEKIEQKFKVGDYVVAKNLMYDYELVHYMKKTVTQIVKIITAGSTKISYIVKYNNPPIHLKEYFERDGSIDDNLDDHELRFATPEEIEKYKLDLISHKYNL